MTRRKRTLEEFKKIVYELEGDSYIVIGEYIDSTTNITMKHKQCDRSFEKTPSKFIHSGQRCSHCYRESNMNKSNFSQLVFEKYGNEYLIVDEYIDSVTNIRFKHNIAECGAVFTKTPVKFLKREQVCICESVNRKLSLKANTFKEKLFEELGDEYLLVGEYTDANSKVTIRHNVTECMREFHPVARQLFRINQRCPFCNTGTSRGEVKIQIYLQDNDIPYESQYWFDDCRLKNPLPFDFAVFNTNNELNYLIEFDGKQHFEAVEHWGGEEAFSVQQIRDQTKNEYCRNYNIKLIRIPYWEFDNIERILHSLIFKDEYEIDETTYLIKNKGAYFK